MVERVHMCPKLLVVVSAIFNFMLLTFFFLLIFAEASIDAHRVISSPMPRAVHANVLYLSLKSYMLYSIDLCV